MSPHAFKLKNKFQLEEEGIGNVLLWDLCYRSRSHKISKFHNKCTPTIIERYHQRSMLPLTNVVKNVLSNKKGLPDV